MIPTLNVGDVLMVRSGPGFYLEGLKVGDIMVFHTNDGRGRIIVHRLFEIYSDDQTGDRLLKTRGIITHNRMKILIISRAPLVIILSDNYKK
jgi:signal peptidase I